MGRKASRSARRPAPKEKIQPVSVPEPPAVPPGRLATLLGRIPWDWLAAAVSMALLAWMVTAGDWDFFPKPGVFESFYDGQARSLLHGRIDVAPDAIGTEAFVRDGKRYGYFGPTPALMRLPLELLLPGMYGRWGVASMLLASALTLGMLLLLMRRLEARFPLAGGPGLRSALRGALILAAAVGSTSLFLSAEHKMYQESIVWASALGFTAAVCLACYLMSPNARWLTLACAAALLGFLARVSSGAGPLVSLALVAAAWMVPSSRVRGFFTGARLPRQAALGAGGTLLIAAVLWGGLNYWKFGQVFTSQPIALNQQFDKERLDHVKGDLISPYNLPLTLSNYLSPVHIEFARSFPWALLKMGDDAQTLLYPNAHFDTFEPFAGLPAGMPELFFGGIAGSALCLARRKQLREFRAPMFGALAGCALIFLFGYISYRYLHDALPWMLLGSAVTVAYLPSIRGKALRRSLAGLFLAATLYAVLVNCAFAFCRQRFACYPVRPETRAAYLDLGSAIDAGGLKAFLSYWSHWRRYIAAASFDEGNLATDTARLAERGDQPVVVSSGQAPSRAGYKVDLPSAGTYEIAIRYAAAEPRPLHLLVNGRDIEEVCASTTGGWLPANRRWDSAGLFKLGGGPNRIGLASDGPFPPVSMLRITRVD